MKVKAFGVSKKKEFIYITIPISEMKSSAFHKFLTKYIPEYVKIKEIEKVEKDCPYCKSTKKGKHSHDEVYISDDSKISLIKGRYEIHLIFNGTEAEKVSAEFDKWFSFVK